MGWKSKCFNKSQSEMRFYHKILKKLLDLVYPNLLYRKKLLKSNTYGIYMQGTSAVSGLLGFIPIISWDNVFGLLKPLPLVLAASESCSS